MNAVTETKPKSTVPLKQRMRGLWQKVLDLKASPAQIAGGFSVGIFASCLPILPFDTPIAIALAWLLGWNVIAAVTATSLTLITVPLVPFLWLAAYQVGRLIVPAKNILKFQHTDLAEVLRMGWDVYQATLVGSVIIATPIALVTYAIIKRLVIRWQCRAASRSGAGKPH